MSTNTEATTEVPTNPANPAPVLLLVHGAWHGAWCWEDEFAPYLRQQGLNVVSMDLPGHGQASPKKIPWYSIADYTNAVEAKLEEIGRPTIVLGHSMGGYVAQMLMERQPKTLAGVILFAAATQRAVLGVVSHLLASRPIDFLIANLTQNLYYLIRKPEQAKALFHSSSMSDEVLQKHWARVGNESFRAFLDMMFLAPIRTSKVPASLPKLVLGGEKDVVFPPNVVERCAKDLAVTATIYDNLPHSLQQHGNWQIVADDIRDWVLRQA